MVTHIDTCMHLTPLRSPSLCCCRTPAPCTEPRVAGEDVLQHGQAKAWPCPAAQTPKRHTCGPAQQWVAQEDVGLEGHKMQECTSRVRSGLSATIFL